MRTKADSIKVGKARRITQWIRRTLTWPDGEYILWHILEHLRLDYTEVQTDAIETIKDLLELVWAEQGGSTRYPVAK